ncbi:MAG: glycosyltransferase [Betaproteobacteria bacterium]|nr:glycosyltransferase [Betaproteobacteria bacterium]
MEASLVSRLVMAGPAPEARGGAATLVSLWREQGLFRRWPIDYIAMHGDGAPAPEALLLLQGLRRLADGLGRSRAVAMHLHASASSPLWRPGLFAALALGLRRPLVLQLHGSGFEGLHDRASTPVRAAMRLALERAACVLVPCEALRAWVGTITREANVRLLLPAVRAAAVASQPAARREKFILYLARIEADKGIEDLVEAFAQVRATIPEARLVCAGEGDRSRVAALAERLGLGKAVKFVGTVGPSGKRALLESAGALALPAYSAGLPLGLLEAMSAGVPVVASAAGGIGEAVVDGASGLLCAPGDKAALARQLKRVLMDSALAARLGAGARETVRARFSPERHLAALEDLYADLGMRALGEPLQPATIDPRARLAA